MNPRHLITTCGPPEQRQHILDFMDSHPDALHRSCDEGHLTGSALIVDATGKRALLMHHRKLGKWLQMGGHADGDPDLARVALREAVEESGIPDLSLALGARPVDLDVHRVEPPGERAHLHLDVRFLAVAVAGAIPAGNHESHELCWFTLDEVAALSDAGMARLAWAARTLLP